MNKLSCQVDNCKHNAHGGCCLDRIQVEGAAANCAKETVCGSYNSKSGASNACCGSKKSPNATVDIGCSADVCCHNKEGHCVATAVDISCNCGCGDRSECTTFQL